MTDNAHHGRTIIALTGDDTVHFLQGILTQDIAKLAAEKIQFAALLSPQGKILHDMFVIDAGAVGGDAGTVLLDTPFLFKDTLLKRLAMYKLRAKVKIADVSDSWHLAYVTEGGLADPRHPQLAHRLYGTAPEPSTVTDIDYHAQRLALGVPDSAYDFAPDSVVAMDGGYDLLHAISFTKGCYVGQEVTARMHYKSIARKGFYILTQNAMPQRLAVLKFDDVEKANGTTVFEDVTYDAKLPDWMLPKFEQFKKAAAE